MKKMNVKMDKWELEYCNEKGFNYIVVEGERIRVFFYTSGTIKIEVKT